MSLIQVSSGPSKKESQSTHTFIGMKIENADVDQLCFALGDVYRSDGGSAIYRSMLVRILTLEGYLNTDGTPTGKELGSAPANRPDGK